MILDREMQRLDGSTESLSNYQGKVVMMVNVASKCGLTPQYKGLQALYERYQGQGLEILGFPANNFMGQEPGTAEEISEFCEINYGVTFPLFAKISVKGEDIHPLYEELTSQPEPIGGEVSWNFQKFIIGRDGQPLAKFGPRVEPESTELVAEIERLLA